MKTNPFGISIIKYFEGLGDGDKQKPGLQPYLDAKNLWTIGFGHVIRTRDGKILRGIDKKDIAFQLYPGIDKLFAEELLKKDLVYVEDGVSRLVKVKINDNQNSALVSLSYNIGLDEDIDTIPEGLGDSTLLRLINESKFDEAALEFPKWNKCAGQVLPGLTKRRHAEMQLFLNQIPKLG